MDSVVAKNEAREHGQIRLEQDLSGFSFLQRPVMKVQSQGTGTATRGEREELPPRRDTAMNSLESI